MGLKKIIVSHKRSLPNEGQRVCLQTAVNETVPDWFVLKAVKNRPAKKKIVINSIFVMLLYG